MAQAGTDSWDEVWDAYEARVAIAAPRSGAFPAGHFAEVAAPAPRPPQRSWLAGGVAAVVFGLGLLAGSTWPLLSLYGLVMRQDAPALLRALDAAPLRDELRQALRDHAGLGRAPAGPEDGAARLLGAMAGEMAERLGAPGGLQHMLAARALPEGAFGLALQDAAAAPLSRLAPAGGLGVSLSLASERQDGGLALRLSYANGQWRATAVQLLDAPVLAGAAPLLLAGPGAGRPLAQRSPLSPGPRA
jgi:hypothetical protein